MTFHIKFIVFALSGLAVFDIWYLASRDFMLVFKLTSVAALLILSIVMHLKRHNIPDYLLLTLAVLGVLFGFIDHKDYASLIALPIFCYLIGYLIKYVSQFFLGDKNLSSEDLKLFLVAGFFLDLNNIGSFFVSVAIFGIVFAILMKRLSIESPYTLAICISMFINLAHNIDILKNF
ncbi:MAG: prepilin peptidase [Alphaproteobacteria bacterium]|jgi:prepilin signal peptidase PulO-like enzyme (type II secretory pathway)|nr:prepilin peptidase [Candidatus Jidaibacter sp.]